MLTSITIQLVALVCLSLAMDKHYKGVLYKPLAIRRKIALRAFGWVLLVISFGLVFTEQHSLAIAIVDWLAWLSCHILLVALLLCWKASLRQNR